jgi:hypothetical protein
MSKSTDLYLTASHRRIIWSITSSQLSAQRRTVNPSHGLLHPSQGTHRFISVSKRTTHPAHGHLPSQGHTTFHLRLREERHTHLMGTPNSWASSPHTGAHNIPSPSQRGTTHPSHGHTQLMGFLTPHRGTQRSISVSERNNTPISWAHPTHGLSHRPTHSVCVLEDVSRSCNHQHSLSGREAISTRPSLSRKYSNFVLAVIIHTPSQLGRYPPLEPSLSHKYSNFVLASGLVKISTICSWVGRYCMCTVFLCTMSLI